MAKEKINYSKVDWLLKRENKFQPLYKEVGTAVANSRDIDPKFKKYQNDPVGFCTEVLKEDFIPSIKDVMRSVLINPVTLAKSSTGIGKCAYLYDSIELIDGSVVSYKDLIDKNFQIYSVDSELNRKISNAYATDNGLKEVLQIETETGKVLTRTINHPLLSCNAIFKSSGNPKISKPFWKNIDELKINDLILAVEKSSYEGYLDIEDEKIKVLAYLIGNGSLTTKSPGFTQADGMIANEFISMADFFNCVPHIRPYKKNPNNKYIFYRCKKSGLITESDLVVFLEENGLLGKSSFEKFVPNCIYKATNKKIALFLSRLYATDGWATSGKPNNSRKRMDYVPVESDLIIEIGYSSVSKRLCEDIQRLLLRFGIVARLRQKKTSWYYKGIKKYGTAYTLDIHDSQMIIKFCDQIGIFSKEQVVDKVYKIAKLKHEKWLNATTRTRKDGEVKWYHQNLPEGYRWEKIKSIKNMGLEPTVCITVPGDETYLTNFVEHNSFSAARMAVWFYKCFPGSQVYVAAAPPESNLKSILWGQIELVTLQNPELFANDNVSASMVISTDSQWFIKGLTIPSSGTPAIREAKFSGHHAPYMLFILDEGDAIPDEVYRGIEGCMSGGFSRLLIMFNPRQQAGPLYIMEREREANVITLSAFEHPNVISGKEDIKGAVTREKTLERINGWTRPLMAGDSTEDIFEVPEFLINQTCRAKDGTTYPRLIGGLRKIVEPAFSYMVLGQYPALGDAQLINKLWIEAAKKRWLDYVALHGETPPEGVPCILGIDVAEMGADFNALCLRYGNYVARIELWTGLDPIQSAEKAALIYHEKGASRAFIDALLIGASVAPSMQRLGCTALGVKVSTSPTRESEFGGFAQLRDQLYWEIREWLRTCPDAMLPPDALLEEELLVPKYCIKNGKVKVSTKDEMRSKLRRSPDRLDSLALTFTQESDKLLHVYDNYCDAVIENEFVIIKSLTGDILEKFELISILDYGFISCSKDLDSWSITRLWLAPGGTIIVPEIYRWSENDPAIIVKKTIEGHLKREFEVVGTYSDLLKDVIGHWNNLEEEMYAATEEVLTPGLVTVKATDRSSRQLLIRDIIRSRRVAFLNGVTKNDKVWNQFGHCESRPDDARDSLAGAITIMLRETGS